MAAHISRAFLLSSTSSSATSFLFQTRTLAPVSRSLYRPFTRRLQHQSSTRDDAPEEDDGRNGDPSVTQDELSQRSFSEEATSSRAANHRPATRRSFLRRRAESVSPRRAESKKPSSSSRPLKSITHHEKLIFADLLGQLKDGEIAAGMAAQSQKPPREAKPNNVVELIAMFDSILDDAQKKKEPATKVSAESQKEPEENVAGLSSDVPDDSDKIRLSDLGLAESVSGKDVEISMQEAVELVVQRESEKIELELFRAIEDGKGDMGLWEVCKGRIFTMLQHLDETTSKASTAPKREAGPNCRPNTRAVIDPEAPTTSPGPLNIPSSVPVSSILVKLYPRTLLIAFRLLNTHFPDSQLISQFRSTIKAHGRTSAVLGTSGALYDEMIYFCWHGCSDLPAIVSILHDMNLHGLSPSPKSRELIRDIIRQRYRELNPASQTDTVKDSFWALPPNQQAFWELSRPCGWLEHFDALARERDRIPLPFTRP